MIKLKYYLLLLCFLYMYKIQAQSVYTALNLNKSEDLRTEYPVSEITTEMTFYNLNGSIEKKKEISRLNEHHQVFSELRYDEKGTLTFRLTRMFDSTGTKSLGTKHERWHKIMGYTFETSAHVYDEKGNLIKTTQKNEKNQVLMVTTITNDEHGNAIELRTTNGNGTLYGIETASYNYETNEVITRVYNTKEELQSETKRKINYTANEDLTLVKNKQGDVIKSGTSDYEYRYDKKNNWVQMICYDTKNGKRMKKSVFSRKINYRKS